MHKLNKNLRKILSMNKYMLGKIYNEKGGKKYIATSMFKAVFNAIVPLSYTIFPGLIINELAGQQRISIIIGLVLSLTITPLLIQLSNSALDKLIIKLEQQINIQLMKVYYMNFSKIDYELLETPSFQELQERATETYFNSFSIVSNLCALATSIISFIAIVSIVATLNPLIILLTLLISYINSIIAKWVTIRQFELRKIFSHFSRLEWAYNYMLNNLDYAKENKVFNVYKLLTNKLTENQINMNEISNKNQQNTRKSNILYSITGSAQQLILYIYLIVQVLRQGLSVGSMSIYLSAVAQFSGSLQSILNEYVRMGDNSNKIEELIEYENTPYTQYNSGTLTPYFDQNSTIEFKNVSFKYPGSDNYVIKNLNLTIHGNEKLCIVGKNGAGKSTFIKLLTRLYSPESGGIYLNGTNIQEYDYEKYQSLFAPVFQDYAQYMMSIKENIILNSDYSYDRFESVCNESELTQFLNHLINGAETQLGKDIDENGIEPSGGEGQKIAIARARYHGGNVFLLDEPTAALDPLAEYEIYKQFSNMIEDKCAVLITHRLSAVQLSDRVVVFENGNVVEYGTHKELYDKGGIYTEMFDKQAQFYNNDIW